MRWNVASSEILQVWDGCVVHPWLYFHVAVWSLTKNSWEAGNRLLLKLENMKATPLELKVLLAVVCSFGKDSDLYQTFRYLKVDFNNLNTFSPP